MVAPVIAVVGATATGKSALAVELAAQLGGEIINADALQVYRGFDIGTAKPTFAEQRGIPHHLLDILGPHETYSAGEFSRRAREAIEVIRSRRAQPIVVGGSGLYLKALIEGIQELPAPDPDIRETLRERLSHEGLGALRLELEEMDPATARRIQPADRQRTLRALEVYIQTGKPLSRWLAERPFGSNPLESVQIGLTVERAVLYDRIVARIEKMIEQGWVAEVSGLLAAGSTPTMPAFQAIGYRQLADHVLGKCSLADSVAGIVRETKRFAKRQDTWFRKIENIRWFSAREVEECTEEVNSYLRSRREFSGVSK